MKINPIISANNFGRAFTTTEKASYKKLVNDVKNELNINDTTAIVFDFNVPSEKGKNTGIGTTFSNEMLNFTSFLKDMVGINSIQLQPQGKITKTNMSPYSGTNFALGEHIIDLQKLTTEDYSCLLTENDIKEADENYKQDKLTREYKTDYAYVLGTSQNNGIQEILLKKAYENFKTNGSEKLNKEFSQFKKENNDWLEKNSLFEALSTEYKTQDITKWKDLDKNLYLSSTKHEERESRIFQIKNKYSDLIDFEDFKQFLAYKQQKESKEILNSENIKIYGDCLIGFSRSEMWSNIDCFKENWYYGGPDPNCSETNNIQTWNLPALDYTQLGECDFDGDISKLGKTGKFLYDKYSTFFKRYDGIRMDAAWQFVTPFIYEQKNGNYQQVNLPEINFTIFNIMKAAAKNVYKENFDKVLIILC
jgi:4-alpha-glucanotransferase